MQKLHCTKKYWVEEKIEYFLLSMQRKIQSKMRMNNYQFVSAMGRVM